MPWILTAKLTLVHLYIWPCNHCLVIMDEGRANEYEPSLNLLGLRQPKHPFLTSDLSHRGFNQSLDCKFDDGLKPIMLLKMMDSELLGLYDIMMDILN